MQCQLCARKHNYTKHTKVVDGKLTILGDIECDHCSGFHDPFNGKCAGFQPKEATQ